MVAATNEAAADDYKSAAALEETVRKLREVVAEGDSAEVRGPIEALNAVIESVHKSDLLTFPWVWFMLLGRVATGTGRLG